ncbi:MAG: PTS sugar transporter subunit IIA [Myxococcales bacterium]|nr:PTS sugar transporter subunit IIA [Myxococcales bacterium]
MDLTSFLDPRAVIPELRAADKTSVLRELTQRLAWSAPEVEEDRLFAALLAREQLGSTGIGDGVAIPHAKVSGLHRIYAVFGRSPAGIDFDDPDGEPTRLFFRTGRAGGKDH